MAKRVEKLVPHQDASGRPFFGSMAGTVLKYERPFDPVDGAWDMDAVLDPEPRVHKRQARKNLLDRD